MEHFFNPGRTEESALSWFGETKGTVLRKPSDFVPYLEQEWMNENWSERRNVNKRMVEMLRRRWTKVEEARVLQSEKSFRHMLKERLRRQSHKEGYAGLHAILPTGTKCDKISVTTAAVLEIMRTRRVLEDLRRRNKELNDELAIPGSDRVEQLGASSNVKMRVGHPVSGIDSMVEVLHCLKDMGLDIKRLRSHFTDQEFSAEIEMDTQMAEDDEVQRAVQRTLVDVEEKLLRQQSSMPLQ